MRNDEMERLLRDVHAPRGGANRSHRDELRDELVARHRRTRPRRQRWKIMTHRIWFRPAVAMLALVALGIVACTAPTEYEVEMGKQLSVSFDGLDKSVDINEQLNEMSAWFEARADVEGVWVGIEELHEGPTKAELTVWGQGLDSAQLEADLKAAFPDLADASIEITDLTGKARGSIAEAMGHNMLHLEVTGDTAEEVRLSILEAMAAQGIEGDIHVHVEDSDGQRTVTIDVENLETGEDAAGESGETMVIELKQD